MYGSNYEYDQNKSAINRGMKTANQAQQGYLNDMMKGDMGVQMDRINGNLQRNLNSGMSTLGASGLSGGAQQGLIGSLGRDANNSRNELYRQAFSDSRNVYDQQQAKLNNYDSLVNLFNTSNVQNPEENMLLRQKLNESISMGSLNNNEKGMFESYLNGDMNRFSKLNQANTPYGFNPNLQNQKGSFIQELGASINPFDGKKGMGAGGFVGDLLTLGLANGVESGRNILQGDGGVDDWMDLGMAALNFIPGVGLVGKGAQKIAGLGAKGIGKAATKYAGKEVVEAAGKGMAKHATKAAKKAGVKAASLTAEAARRTAKTAATKAAKAKAAHTTKKTAAKIVTKGMKKGVSKTAKSQLNAGVKKTATTMAKTKATAKAKNAAYKVAKNAANKAAKAGTFEAGKKAATKAITKGAGTKFVGKQLAKRPGRSTLATLLNYGPQNISNPTLQYLAQRGINQGANRASMDVLNKLFGIDRN